MFVDANLVKMKTEWVYTDEPHRTRRRQILGKNTELYVYHLHAKHPEIRRLMGHDPRLAYTVILLVMLQLTVAWLLRHSDWFYIIPTAYVISGTCNNALLLAIHEISHNLAFGHMRASANRLLGYFANLPLGVPYSMTFRKYHMKHHRYQGDEQSDIDIPSKIETKLFCSAVGKFVWVALLPLLYVMRGVFLHRRKPIERSEIMNAIIQLAFDAFILHLMGLKSLLYLASGTLLGLGLHPVAGHFLASHHMFVRGQETYSYYGILNKVTFNIGYHNEHHDFPNIPASRLPMVKKLAPEFYDVLPCHSSWLHVIYEFIFNPHITLESRVKRGTGSSGPSIASHSRVKRRPADIADADVAVDRRVTRKMSARTLDDTSPPVNLIDTGQSYLPVLNTE